jgi:hypothetical protein
VIAIRSRPVSHDTPRAAGLAGCVLLACVFAPALAGCGHGEAPRVRVVNHSGQRLDDLWIRTQHDSTRVPSLKAGDSVEVRPRVQGEDLLWLSGRFEGRYIQSMGGDYVEGTGGYRFRAVIDSGGHATVKFVRLGLW